MSTALLVMTDGRKEILIETMFSFGMNVWNPDLSLVYVNNDSPDEEYHAWLEQSIPSMFPEVPVLVAKVGTGRSGFGGAIRNAWAGLNSMRQHFSFDWVFHLEDDFTFERKINLGILRGFLIHYPYLAQMALKRQPWGSDFQFANGFMEAYPEHYTEHDDDDDWWVETRRNWTTNPSIFRADLLAGGWPEDPFSEGKYGFVLKEGGLPWRDPGTGELVPGDEVQFGIWGRIDDPPLVYHIGTYRVGEGY
jgi:hypothetical protein